MKDGKRRIGRLKPLLGAAGGTTVLVVGLLASCQQVGTSGNLIAPQVDAVEDGTQKDAAAPSDVQADAPTDTAVSGNLIPPDVSDVPDTPPDTQPDPGVSGNLMVPDVDEVEVHPADTGPDLAVSGNLLPPDVQMAEDASPTK